ncbi:hypothetical protein IMSAG049_00432 [Clostridiales bacterium]|nr:hypothetical protein IMSAG049_00432 [Clostridiales bacterium]
MECEKIFNKACALKEQGINERAYELFAEVVHDFPGTEFAILANQEMTTLAVNNSCDNGKMHTFNKETRIHLKGKDE